ncbi:helix-turn-helix domain-containing protein [Pseudomonas chlororaphis]|uniref:helix-turn-helix domain-containing protein n=1 Tax=Pseudomonas chlororaphis TaxID=587753 RepID=UPI0015DE0D54|nr:AraC family transcriptional regulator [Pseudomonas chlororaphis]QLL11962.1 helix-turn-helix transcriptional regulator [Pseudomonas chlororaphis subsp. aurantiaca]
MRTPEWTGQLWLGRDYGLIQGELGRTAPHAHYAHQLILASAAPVTVSLDDQPCTARYVFIPAMQRHAILDAPGTLFTLYAEPLTIDAQALQHSLLGVELTLPALAEALQRCPRRTLDRRIEKALAALDRQLTGKVSASTLAAHAHLSLSQLERLFSGQLGLPVRRLVLWRRLRLAMGLVLAGQAITDAAHGAGFADSAHFSRTLKTLFGVTARQALQHIELRLLD